MISLKDKKNVHSLHYVPILEMKNKVNLDLGSAIRENVHKSEKELMQLMKAILRASDSYMTFGFMII